MDRVGLILLCLGAVGMGRLCTEGRIQLTRRVPLPTWLEECCTDDVHGFLLFLTLRSASRRRTRDS